MQGGEPSVYCSRSVSNMMARRVMGYVHLDDIRAVTALTKRGNSQEGNDCGWVTGGR